jgi:hypothetical protein
MSRHTSLLNWLGAGPGQERTASGGERDNHHTPEVFFMPLGSDANVKFGA